MASDDCCVALTSAPIDKQAAMEMAKKFKALSDPTRVRLLSMVAAHENGEASVRV